MLEDGREECSCSVVGSKEFVNGNFYYSVFLILYNCVNFRIVFVFSVIKGFLSSDTTTLFTGF